MVKKYGELYLQARRSLMVHEDAQTASFMSRNLICQVTGKTYEQVLTVQEHYASEEEELKLMRGVTRLLNGEPLAYVLGQWDFYGMTLQVTPEVLIPRDDTCAVTALAAKYALFLSAEPRILDLCTGSGCIGLALAHRISDAKVTLADISKEALAVAKKNIVGQKLSARVRSVQADALNEPSAFLGEFDMIVSNPPYITSQEMTELPRSVKDFEPHLALHGGQDGLDFYRSIAQNYKKALKNGGFLCFEFGMGQGDDVCSILEHHGYTVLERTEDLNHIERAIIARYDRKD